MLRTVFMSAFRCSKTQPLKTLPPTPMASPAARAARDLEQTRF
jgi:hypothetical protein